MSAASLLDLSRPRPAGPGDPDGLRVRLAALVGEPFRFARVSYGDELTLHFGDLRPGRSARLAGKPFGAYLLGVRGSAWAAKAGSAGRALVGGPDPGPPVSAPEVEADPVLATGARVVSAEPFPTAHPAGFGLHVRLSDGATLTVTPTPPEADPDGLPEVADWELLTPAGLLTAGPGPVWAFTPSGDERP